MCTVRSHERVGTNSGLRVALAAMLAALCAGAPVGADTTRTVAFMGLQASVPAACALQAQGQRAACQWQTAEGGWALSLHVGGGTVGVSRGMVARQRAQMVELLAESRVQQMIRDLPGGATQQSLTMAPVPASEVPRGFDGCTLARQSLAIRRSSGQTVVEHRRAQVCVYLPPDAASLEAGIFLSGPSAAPVDSLARQVFASLRRR